MLYDLFWWFALPVLRLNKRLSEGFKERTSIKQDAPSDLWIQAASVGESNLAVTIINNLSPPHPVRVMLTSGTDQGVELLKHYTKNILCNDKIITDVAYFPFDKPAIMEQAVNVIRPRVMVLLETELWPGLLCALKKHKSKTVIINGRINPKNLAGYRLWPLFWHTLKPDHILAISRNDAKRFEILFNTNSVESMHNIKFDQVSPMAPASLSKCPVEHILPPDKPFIVLGAVRKEEEQTIKKVILNISQKAPHAILGLFPRHMHRIKFWEKTLNRLNIPWILRSEISEPVSCKTVILWDVMGELSHAYKLSKAAFVGGTLAPLGGQNFLEALTSGVIPVIGPSWENFAWVGDEIVAQGLVSIAKDWKNVVKKLIENLDHADSHEKVLEAAFKYVKERQGGTNRACDLICKHLDNK